MGVYSVMLPDEKIINAVNGFKQIVILGCGACANESLAYDKNKRLKVIFDKHTGNNRLTPDAVMEEANRLKAILENKVEDISIMIGKGLCSRASNKTEEWLTTCQKAEAVITLCCAGGAVGVKKGLEKTVKVIPGMKSVGVFFSYTVFDPITGLVYIDKEKSSFMRIFERKTSC